MIEPYLPSQDSLLKRIRDRNLQDTPGIYLIRCKKCGHPLYGGKTADLGGRLTSHAFIPPWGAVDIIFGDPVLPELRNRFCEHLKKAKKLPRKVVVRLLLAEVEVLEAKKDRSRREGEMFRRFPEAYGRGHRLWRNPVEFVDYYLGKGAGYCLGKARGSNHA